MALPAQQAADVDLAQGLALHTQPEIVSPQLFIISKALGSAINPLYRSRTEAQGDDMISKAILEMNGSLRSS